MKEKKLGKFVPDRGDLIWLNFSPQSGHEQAGKRPALVLSPKAYNEKVGLALCCPIASKVKGYPFEVGVPKGLKITGVILSDQMRSLDWKTRAATLIDRVPLSVIRSVQNKISLLIID